MPKRLWPVGLAGQHKLLRSQGARDGRLQRREEGAISDCGVPTPVLENREKGGDSTAESDVLPGLDQVETVRDGLSSNALATLLMRTAKTTLSVAAEKQAYSQALWSGSRRLANRGDVGTPRTEVLKPGPS